MRIGLLGHYPVAGPEDRVVEKLRQGTGPVPIVFGLSLEDPLFESLGTDRLKTLMETLGMKEDECIEHTMVSKAISRARKKLEDQAKDERRTATESEWFTRNIKQQL